MAAISSTGHMILAEEFIKMNMTDEFMEMFRVVIQLGAIMAVIVLYWNKLFPFPSKWGEHKERHFSLWIKVLAATLPAALIGLPFDDKIDEMFYNYITVAITLIVYGVLFIVMENRNKWKVSNINSFDRLNYRAVLLIGHFRFLPLFREHPVPVQLFWGQ